MDIIMNEYWMESLFLSFKTATTKLHRANHFVLGAKYWCTIHKH